MTELSPAAEAVFRAATNADDWSEESIAAATLRAMTDWFHSFDTAKECYQKMHAVADELDELANRKCEEKQLELCDFHTPGPE
jgi:hypothetical protein